MRNAPAGELAETLPGRLDIPQILRVGAVNALMANTDAIMLKVKNYIYYDWAGPRLYFPWDLDTSMREGYDVVFPGSVSGGTTIFTDALFTHWEDDYAAILTDLLDGPLALEQIHGEIDRAVSVAGEALEADPHLDGAASAAGDSMRSWWTARHAAVAEQVAAH